MVSQESMEWECGVFTRYLLGCSPQSYVVQKYAEAHCVSAVFSTGNRFDYFLLRVANVHPLLSRMADSYARMFAPASLLRKKLVLLLAILETSAPSCHSIDAVDGGGRVTLAARMMVRGVGFGLNVIAGAIIFLPFHMILAADQRKAA